MKFSSKREWHSCLMALCLVFSSSRLVAGPCASKCMNEYRPIAPKSVKDVFAITDLNSTIQTYLNPRENAVVRRVNSHFYSASRSNLVQKATEAFYQSDIWKNRLVVGRAHFCVIAFDGHVRCGGSRQPPITLGKVVSLVSEGDRTCVIKADSTVGCWGGYNQYVFSDRGFNFPNNLGKVRALSAGKRHTCAIKIDDKVECWGDNGVGQSAVPPDLGRVRAIFTGDFHTCAIKEDETVQCWGNHREDFNPGVAPPIGRIQFISSGIAHICVIKEDGTVQCWRTIQAFNPIVAPPDLGKVKALVSGIHYSCAIKENDTLQCWGGNSKGQTSVPPDLGRVQSVLAGDSHVCVLKEDRTVQCWGDNSYGQITVPPDLGQVLSISNHNNKMCAIRENGTVQCWGLGFGRFDQIVSDKKTSVF